MIYIKIRGYEVFYRAKYKVHISQKGWKIAELISAERISRREYYAQPAQCRYIRPVWLDPCRDYVHEIGNGDFFKALRECARYDK